MVLQGSRHKGQLLGNWDWRQIINNSMFNGYHIGLILVRMVLTWHKLEVYQRGLLFVASMYKNASIAWRNVFLNSFPHRTRNEGIKSEIRKYIRYSTLPFTFRYRTALSKLIQRKDRSAVRHPHMKCIVDRTECSFYF